MTMHYTHLLPLTLIIIDCGAAALYAWDADWRRGIYWTAAAILTASVTF